MTPVARGSRVQIRLASPSEYAAVGDLTVDAYTADGYLDDSDDYADHLRDAAGRAVDADPDRRDDLRTRLGWDHRPSHRLPCRHDMTAFSLRRRATRHAPRDPEP